MFPAYSVKARNSKLEFNTREFLNSKLIVLLLETRYSIEHHTHGLQEPRAVYLNIRQKPN